MSKSPISEAYSKRRHADKHIHELRKVISAFSRAYPAEVITHQLPNGAPRISFKTPDEPVPDEIALILGDALHNLRSSLDLMMVACYAALGKGTSGVKFPFAQDSAQLEAIIKKDLAHGGLAICDLIRGTRPFKGGNIPLRGLHDLDISDKHKTLISVPRQGLYDQVEMVTEVNGKIVLRVRGGEILKNRTNPKTKIKSLETFAVLPRNYETTAIVFSDSMPFAGEPVLDVLEKLCSVVDGILEAFEAAVI